MFNTQSQSVGLATQLDAGFTAGGAHLSYHEGASAVGLGLTNFTQVRAHTGTAARTSWGGPCRPGGPQLPSAERRGADATSPRALVPQETAVPDEEAERRWLESRTTGNKVGRWGCAARFRAAQGSRRRPQPHAWSACVAAGAAGRHQGHAAGARAPGHSLSATAC